MGRGRANGEGRCRREGHCRRVPRRHDSLNYDLCMVRAAIRGGPWHRAGHRFDSMNSSIPARPDAGVVRRSINPGDPSVPRCALGSLALACLLAALLPNPVSAVGLGAITQQSALGQPLRVVVPVTLGDGEELAPECFRITAADRDVDGIPQLLFGRVNVERSPSGTALVVTNARTVSDPIVRLTIQAGCEAAIRREYTLLMDPPAIEAPVVAAESAPREPVVAPPPPPAARDARRPARPTAPRAAAPRASTRTAPAAGSDAAADATRKPAAAKGRTIAKAVPKRPPAAVADQPRLSLSSGAGSAATEADREKAQQERAAAIDAETQVLRQRIVELTALVERMQQELRAQEQIEQAAAEAAKAAAQAPAASAPPEPAKAASASAAATPPPPPAADWWDDSAALTAALVLLPLLIAAALLIRRRQAVAEDEQWRPRATIALGAPESISPMLRNATAGLASSGPESVSTVASKGPPADPAVDALAVSELSHATEEARVFVALGHPERAIEALQEHLRRHPRSMPAAWLMLLSLHHSVGNRPEFRRLAEDFHAHFNVQVPLWEGFDSDEPGTGGLDGFPHVQKQLVELWRKPGCRAYLERLLHDNREGRRIGFPLTAYGEILLLLQVIDAPEDIDVNVDLVESASLDADPAEPAASAAPPRATAAGVLARARKPMPPDPAASRPVQQPIRFDIGPRDSGDKPKS